MAQVELIVNGVSRTAEAPGAARLVDVLREGLGLTGTHIGCDTGQCGACMVHLDGRAVKSCMVVAGAAQGARVTTIEGVAEAGEPLHPMQAAFLEHNALQCGFCTPGMIMSALDMVRRAEAEGRTLTREGVTADLMGNFCRCTGYTVIVDAILDGAARMGAAPAPG